MGHILIPRRHYSQPAGYFRLAPWLPPGSMVWIGTQPMRTLGIEGAVTFVGSAGMTVGRAGAAMFRTTEVHNSGVHTVPANLLFASDAGTIAVFYEPHDTVLRTSELFGWANGTENRVLANAPWSDGIVYFDWGNASGNRVSTAFGGKTVAPQALVFSNGPAHGQRIYRHGRPLVSGTQKTTTHNARAFCIGGANRDDGAPHNDNHSIYLCVTSRVEWSESMVRLWSANPWSIAAAPE